MIRKADIILAAFLIASGLAVSFFLSLGEEAGQMVYITADGKEYAYYPLSEDRTVTVTQKGHINKITIKGGKVSMVFSDCHNKDCIQRGEISKTSQSIICLPNKLVVEIRGSSSEYDAVVQ